MRVLLLPALALACLASPVAAHPGGHDEQYRAPEPRPVSELAQEAVIKLVAQAKLPSSWAKAKLVKSEARTKKGARQVVVTFRNTAERRETKRLLYVLMTPDGDFISANHRLS